MRVRVIHTVLLATAGLALAQPPAAQKPAEPQARRDYRDDDDEEDTEPPSC